MAWSHDLLDAGEQALFRRLAVFAGGCTVEAAAAVCALPGDPALDILHTLESLVDKSLLRREDAGSPGDPTQAGGDGAPRFTMLQTVRAYALERLAACGEAEELRRRHAAYYQALAKAAEQEVAGPRQTICLARLAREHDNLRAARQWAQESAGTETGPRLAGATELPDGWAIVGALPEQPERVA
jgi:predicted ATPase